jgi:RNA polymerase sigma factor (sigma-70 family)
MPISQISEFLQNIRRAALRRDEAGLTDGQLLDAYVHSREEAAFAALVRRHGPMVWGVCRRILGNEGDAEDAFQATFLVLVRKAASIVPREQIANWLYGVAQQTAVKARAMAVKRKAREKQVQDMPEPAVREQGSPDDLLPLLDQELSRLPDKYRTAIVLCDLEGKSYKEAARQLGCPEGTLAARLTRGRAMLAKRLARHGLAVSGGVLATALSQSASATVPALVVSSTIKAVSLFATGTAVAVGVITPTVAALTEGVLKTMFVTKLKIVSAVVLTVLLCFGSGVLMHRASARSQTTPASPVAPTQAEGIENPKGEEPKNPNKKRERKEQPLEERTRTNAKLQVLLKERVDILRKNVERMKDLHEQHAAGLDAVWQANLRLYKAELDLCETTKDRIAVLEKIVDVYKEMENRLSQLKKQRAASQDVVDDAKLNRLEAEIALEREKIKLVPLSK